MFIPFPSPNPHTVLGTRRWAEWLLGGALHPGGTRLTEHLLEEVAVGDRDEVAELGCGSGHMAPLLASRGARLLGIDSSREALRAAQERGNGSWVQATGGMLPLRPASVDVVVAESALWLAGGLDRALAESLAALRPGGRIGFAEFVRESGVPLAGPEWAHMTCVEQALPEARLVATMRAAGFEEVRVKDESWALFDLEAEVQRRIDVLGLLATLAQEEPDSELASLHRFTQQARRERDEGRLRYVIATAVRRA